jgi:hypothetical protein
MTQKFKLDDKEYGVENLTASAKTSLISLKFATNRIQELNNIVALLQRAKESYLDSLKREILSSKAGFNFNND